MATPAELREQAKRLRESAEYADRNEDRRRDLDGAARLEHQAADMERAEFDASSPPAASAPSAEANEKRRKALVAKIKIAQKQLGMDDDTYRAFLEGVTGKRSASLLMVWELENAIKALRDKGFKQAPAQASGSRPQADDDQSRLIRSLWLQLYDASKVRDSSERALVNWVRGQVKSSTGIEALQWLSMRQKRRIIEQLKLWLAR